MPITCDFEFFLSLMQNFTHSLDHEQMIFVEPAKHARLKCSWLEYLIANLTCLKVIWENLKKNDEKKSYFYI